MNGLAWSSLLEALTRVERVNGVDSGLLSFGSTLDGGIFVENSRICWAAAAGLQRRLRELLRGKPNDYEAAIRRHSAESLVELASRSRPTHWSARPSGFAPRFTFGAFDLLLDVIELELPGVRDSALEALAPVMGPGRYAASFHIDEATGVAVPVASSEVRPTVDSAARLGRWAARLPVATRDLPASPRFALATTAAGDTVSVWWRASLLHVVVCSDRASAASVAGYHLSSPP